MGTTNTTDNTEALYADLYTDTRILSEVLTFDLKRQSMKC